MRIRGGGFRGRGGGGLTVFLKWEHNLLQFSGLLYALVYWLKALVL